MVNLILALIKNVAGFSEYVSEEHQVAKECHLNSDKTKLPSFRQRCSTAWLDSNQFTQDDMQLTNM